MYRLVFTDENIHKPILRFLFVMHISLLLLYISGNETKNASKAHLSTVARKPEETCKQGHLLCGPETPG